MYQASVPSLIRSLNNLVAILAKGAAHAEAKKIDPTIALQIHIKTYNRKTRVSNNTYARPLQ